MANAWDALLQPARPISTGPNPDYDQAMGINTNTGDDLQNALGQLQSIQQRNTPVGQAMTMEIAKEKMANQLALQLMQQKMQLQRQYPEYQAHPTPWGSVLMVNPYNPDDSKEVGGFAGAKDTYIAAQQAGMAKDKAQTAIMSDPSYVQNQLDESKAKVDLTRAQTGEAQAMAALRPAQVQAQLALAGNRETKGNDLSEKDITDITNRIYTANDFDPKKPFTAPDGVTASSLQPKVDAAIAAERARRQSNKLQTSTGAGLAAPAAQATPPDLSGLMQPLSD